MPSICNLRSTWFKTYHVKQIQSKNNIKIIGKRATGWIFCYEIRELEYLKIHNSLHTSFHINKAIDEYLFIQLPKGSEPIKRVWTDLFFNPYLLDCIQIHRLGPNINPQQQPDPSVSSTSKRTIYWYRIHILSNNLVSCKNCAPALSLACSSHIHSVFIHHGIYNCFPNGIMLNNCKLLELTYYIE